MEEEKTPSPEEGAPETLVSPEAPQKPTRAEKAKTKRHKRRPASGGKGRKRSKPKASKGKKKGKKGDKPKAKRKKRKARSRDPSPVQPGPSPLRGTTLVADNPDLFTSPPSPPLEPATPLPAGSKRRQIDLKKKVPPRKTPVPPTAEENVQGEQLLAAERAKTAQERREYDARLQEAISVMQRRLKQAIEHKDQEDIGAIRRELLKMRDRERQDFSRWETKLENIDTEILSIGLGKSAGDLAEREAAYQSLEERIKKKGADLNIITGMVDATTEDAIAELFENRMMDQHLGQAFTDEMSPSRTSFGHGRAHKGALYRGPARRGAVSEMSDGSLYSLDAPPISKPRMRVHHAQENSISRQVLGRIKRPDFSIKKISPNVYKLISSNVTEAIVEQLRNLVKKLPGRQLVVEGVRFGRQAGFREALRLLISTGSVTVSI